ncbi:MAG: glycosyltransferase family 4 protein [Planctomycetota bacterium]
MRIVHLVADWRWTGPAAPAVELASCEAAAGARVTLVCGARPAGVSGAHLPERASALGLTDVRTFRLGSNVSCWRNLLLSEALRSMVRHDRPDAVHVHDSFGHLLALWGLRRLRDRPVLVRSNHRADPMNARAGERFLARRCAGLLECSARAAEADRAAFPALAPRIAHAFGGVDLERFRPGRSESVRANWGIAQGEFLFGAVARIQARRRFDVLLEAFKRVRAEAPLARLAILGRGSREKQVAFEPAEGLGISKAVVFPGYVTDSYEETLRSFDAGVFLMPGTDGSCRAAREMMATGLPVAGFAAGILPEILPEGGGTAVFPDPAALAAAMLEILRDPAARKTRGEAARAFAEKYFRWEDVVKTAFGLCEAGRSMA